MVIWKYSVDIEGRIELSMPRNAKILTIQTQFGRPCIWALVNENEVKTKRYFRIVGTGHEFDPTDYKYVNTFQVENGTFVFHLFEKNQ